MANAIYARVREGLLGGTFTWTGMDLVVTAWMGHPWFDETDQTYLSLRTHGPTDVAHSLPMTDVAGQPGGYAASGAAVIETPPVGTISFLTLAERLTPIENSKLILFLDTGHDLPYFSNGLDMIIQPDWLQKRGWFRP